jgi:hypothetical protein
MKRRIFTLTTAPHSNGGDPHVYAVANDGTAWELVAGNWVQFPDLPQPVENCSRECEARQYSDQMLCKRCDLGWDMNDPHPPSCRKL